MNSRLLRPSFLAQISGWFIDSDQVNSTRSGVRDSSARCPLLKRLRHNTYISSSDCAGLRPSDLCPCGSIRRDAGTAWPDGSFVGYGPGTATDWRIGSSLREPSCGRGCWDFESATDRHLNGPRLSGVCTRPVLGEIRRINLSKSLKIEWRGRRGSNPRPPT